MRSKYQIRIVWVVCIRMHTPHSNGKCFMRDVLVVVPRKCSLLLSYLLLTFSFLLLLHPNTNAHTHESPKFSRFLCFRSIYLWPRTQSAWPRIQDASGQNCVYCSRHGLISKSNQKIIPQIFIPFVLRNNVIVFAFLTTPHRTHNCTAWWRIVYSLHTYVAYMLTGRSTFFCASWLMFCSQAQYNSGALQLQKFFLFSHLHPRCVCVNEQFSVLIWSTKKRKCTRVEREEEDKERAEEKMKQKYLISFVNPILMWNWSKSRERERLSKRNE